MKTTTTATIMAAALSVAVAAFVVPATQGRAQPPGPAIREAVALSGLSAPGEIVVDHWGVAHI